MIKPLLKAGRLLAAKPTLALCIGLVGALLLYRELYHREVNQSLSLAAEQAQATVRAQEIAAERRYEFMQQELSRLEAERQERMRMQQLERAALAEMARMNEMANEQVQAKRNQIEQLKAAHASLSARVPDPAVRLFESSEYTNSDRARIRGGTGPD